jgi:sulfur carrier protein ThiS
MKLYAGGFLTFYTPGQQPEIEHPLAEAVKLDEILADIGIPVGEVQLTVLNGVIVDLHQAIVRDQDMVKVFPGVDGG